MMPLLTPKKRLTKQTRRARTRKIKLKATLSANNPISSIVSTIVTKQQISKMNMLQLSKHLSEVNVFSKSQPTHLMDNANLLYLLEKYGINSRKIIQ